MGLLRAILIAAPLALNINGLSLDTNSVDSIKTAAKTLAQSIIDDYPGTKSGNSIGIWNAPYYWWSSGNIWDTLVDYWFLTGDSTYNDVVAQAIQAQIGPQADYMPPNQTKSEGNDDQQFWVRAALSAAERGFPITSNAVPYVKLASNVFDEQVVRWDTATCNGGLRWQIFTFNNGYNYKNSISNAGFFLLAARLAKFTGNSTYSDWAGKSFDWLETVGFIDPQTGAVYDGSDATTNCSSINHIEWSENLGILLHGSAIMYNMTNGSQQWQTRIEKLLGRLSVFTDNNIFIEVACESTGTCATDQTFFKGVLASSLGHTAQFAPFTASKILPLLKGSAEAAVTNACSNSNEFCSFIWTAGNSTSASALLLGPQLAALQVVQANLVSSKALTITSSNSSTSTTGNSTSGGPKPTTTSNDASKSGNLSEFGMALVLVLAIGLLSGI